VDSISAAEELAGCEVQIPASDRMALRSGEVYLSDLIGCEVVENGAVLGVIEAIQEMPGARLLLQVRTPRGELLIPFAEEFCTRIDLEHRRVEVQLPEGLKELNERSSGSPADARSDTGNA
jgi:16S rRNA processing protein RimM